MVYLKKLLIGSFFLTNLAMAAPGDYSSTPDTSNVPSQKASFQSSVDPETKPKRRTSFYVHPVLTLISIVAPQLPVIITGTIERRLENNLSFIWQQQFAFGSPDYDADDAITLSQFSAQAYPGIRSYFSGDHSGFYLQGSGSFGFSSISATNSDLDETADGIFTAIGALGYIGYKWSKVFIDIGAGAQTVNGTLNFSNGQEVDFALSGLAVDFNLGFGF